MKFVLQVFAGDFASKVFLGLAGLALIRWMPEGEYAVLTLATVLSAFVVQGITGNLNRVFLVGKKQLGLEESPQLFLAMQVWLLVVIAAVSAPFLLTGSSIAGVFGLVVALTFANCLLEIIKTFYQQELKFASLSLIEFTRTAVFVFALIWLVISQGKQLQAWHVLMLQAVCVASVVLVVFGRRMEWSALLRVREVWALSKSVLSSRYLLMVGYFFGVAMLVRIDVLMLSLLAGDFDLATFGASFRYYSILMMMLAALHTVFLPLMQRVKTRGGLQKLFGQHRKIVALAVPVIICGAWASAWIIPFIDGGRYPGAVDVFRVLSLSAIISLACSPHANLLLRYGGFGFLFTICTVAIAANVGMNAVMIPAWGAVGAAWATLVAAGGVNVLIYFRSKFLLANHPLPDCDSPTQTNTSSEKVHEDVSSETTPQADHRTAA
jgi:O-antigen/teichoic acid export membrane protein